MTKTKPYSIAKFRAKQTRPQRVKATADRAEHGFDHEYLPMDVFIDPATMKQHLALVSVNF